MKNLANKILHIFLVLVISSSCTQKKPAKIILKGDKKYNNRNHSSKKTSEFSKPEEKITSSNAKYHTVIAGDTVYSIARNYDKNVEDLIKINNLEKPYNIRVGDQIKITAYQALEKKSPDISNNKSEYKADNNDLEEKQNSEEKQIASKNNKFIWPIKGKIVSKFGAKAGGLYNDGINIKANNGDGVKATEDGTIAYVGNELRGYGNLIIMKHAGGWISAYAHLEKFEVKRGDKVKKGTLIAKVGSTGNVDSPQLYFGIRKGKEAINPEIYLTDEEPVRNDKPSKAPKKIENKVETKKADIKKAETKKVETKKVETKKVETKKDNKKTTKNTKTNTNKNVKKTIKKNDKKTTKKPVKMKLKNQ